jgi:hypothetical protein
MFQKDWKKLTDALGEGYSGWNSKEIDPDLPPLRFKAMRIKDKGAIVTLVSASEHGGTIRYECGSTDRIGFDKLERVDDAGNVIIPEPRDMLGEVISIGSWVSYPTGSRDNHYLSVGRVSDIKGGVLRVKAKVTNGERIEQRWVTEENARPERCVKLPVDVARLTMAIFTDFESIDGSRD